jgi:hypothetical protein
MKDYIPTTLSSYNDWQASLVETVTTNEVPWGLDAGQLATLQTNSATYKPLYAAIKHTETRTPQQVYAHDTYKKTYTKFLRGYVQGQLVNNILIPADNLVAMGLNPHLYIRAARPTITSYPAIALSTQGGGKIRFRCTVPDSDSKGRHSDSNGIELFYVTESASKTVNPVDPTPSEKVAEQEQEFLASIFSPRANFVHGFGLSQVGKVLRVYGRWVNLSDASKNGPFSGIGSIVIS